MAIRADSVEQAVPAGRRTSGLLGGTVAPDAWLATTHLLLNLWVGLATFIPVVVLLALSLGLTPVFLVGVPLLGVTLWLSRLLGRLERRRFALTLGVVIPESQPRRLPGGVLARLRARAGSGAGWREVSYHLLRLPVGAVEFALTLACWSAPVALLALPTYNRALPNGGADFGLVSVRSWWSTVLVGLLGVVLLLLAPRLVRGLARADVAFARALLGPPGQLEARVGELERSRAPARRRARAHRRDTRRAGAAGRRRWG